MVDQIIDAEMAALFMPTCCATIKTTKSSSDCRGTLLHWRMSGAPARGWLVCRDLSSYPGSAVARWVIDSAFFYVLVADTLAEIDPRGPAAKPGAHGPSIG
jgi:hypothetical protein